MLRTALVLVLGTWLGACATPSAAHPSPTQEPSPMISLDVQSHPQLRFRIDAFAVPEAARPEFDAAAGRNLAFLRTLPGFQGHWVFEKTAGPGRFTIVTVAVWDSQEAMDAAASSVRAYYQRIGFDPPSFMAQRGIAGEIGTYRAVP